MNDFKYVGSELELFAAAHNWKAYWSEHIRPFVKGDVLEVGAGIGANTPYLDRGGNRRWVCLEPDPLLTAQLSRNLAETSDGREYEIISGTLQSLAPQEKFDSILYIDVLEHIENDRAELEAAAARLNPGGRVIVLSPAHQWLFTPFDAAIGHFRRYNRTMLRSISPAALRLEQISYLDSLGLTLSAGNRLFLKQSMPTKSQLRFWDRWVVPASRVLDKFIFGAVGKTIVGVWQREKR